MPELQGIHHVALFTLDMDETVRFWTSVMKARLVRAGAQDEGDPGLRQYYFDVGGSLIAFFHFPAQDREALQFGWMHHVALRVKSEKELPDWKTHIESFGVQVSETRDQGFVKSLYLHDPNGILIELAATARDFMEDDLKKDPRPVGALKEMLAE